MHGRRRSCSASRRRARTNAVPKTSTPTMVAIPPTASPQRGPNSSLTQPTIGPPMGVLPSIAMVYTAMTRPRMTGSARSWICELQVARNAICPAPTSTSRPISTPSDGASAATQMADAVTPMPVRNTRFPRADDRLATNKRTEECARAHRDRHRAVDVGVPVEGHLGQEGQHHRRVDRERADDQGEQQRGTQLRASATRSAARRAPDPSRARAARRGAAHRSASSAARR